MKKLPKAAEGGGASNIVLKSTKKGGEHHEQRQLHEDGCRRSGHHQHPQQRPGRGADADVSNLWGIPRRLDGTGSVADGANWGMKRPLGLR